MPPEVDVLSCFGMMGVEAWGEKGLGLPVTLPVCPVFVDAGDATIKSKTACINVIPDIYAKKQKSIKMESKNTESLWMPKSHSKHNSLTGSMG